MESVKFSILVPVYKAEKYIDECIKSILSQTYSNWEMILVDDGSPDKSGEICDKYADNDKRIKVIHKQNEGTLSARNCGIENSSGDFILFIDSDDYIASETLQVLNETVVNNNSDCIIFCMDTVTEMGEFIDSLPNKIDSVKNITDKEELYSLVFFNRGYYSLCNKAVKRDYLINKDYKENYNISLSEDLLQSLDIYKSCNRITIIPNSLYKYRYNPNSVTHTASYKNNIDRLHVREKVIKFLKQENVLSDEKIERYITGNINVFLVSYISSVAVSDLSHKEKLKLLKSMYKWPFYKEVLSKYFCNGVRIQRTIFWLFKHKLFRTILFLFYMNNLKKVLLGRK